MLREREVDFAYGYRMTCDVCNTANWLTADHLYAARLSAEVPCSTGGHDFKFGYGVIGLRDLEDVALDDGILPQLAWYHTTTVPNWPARSKLLSEIDVTQFSRANWSADRVEREKSQALHLGTYEAALESMLRNMDQRGHQRSTFYLHRVRLRPDVSIAKDLRDENNELADNITIGELPKGKDGIRYLNAHESMGGVSLAVVREAIESTQSIVVPVPGLVGPPSEAVVDRVVAFRKEMREICETLDGTAKGARAIALRLEALRGGQSSVQLEPSPEVTAPPEAHKILREMNNFLGDEYLAGISPVVREDFLQRLHRPKPSDDLASDLAWLSKFMGLAALFTRPSEVQRKLDAQPWLDIRSSQAD